MGAAARKSKQSARNLPLSYQESHSLEVIASQMKETKFLFIEIYKDSLFMSNYN